MHAIKPRFHELDLLRGMACAMVVAFHFLYRGQVPGWVTDHAIAPVEAMARYGYLGVHLFFITSGFVIFMTAENASVRDFVASRVARLYPALWVAAPLTAICAWAAESETFAVTPTQLLFNLSMVPQWFHIDFVDGSYWSLAVELQFYVLMAVVISLQWMHRIEALLAGWLLLALVDLVRPIYLLEFWLAANWAPFFTAGICCYLLRVRGATPARWALLAAAYLLTMGSLLRAALYPETGTADWRMALVPAMTVSVFFLVFLCIALNRWHVKVTALTRWAGVLTYPVYLVHQNIGYLLLDVAHQHHLPFSVAVVGVCALIVAIAWQIHTRVEIALTKRLRLLIAARRGPAMA